MKTFNVYRVTGLIGPKGQATHWEKWHVIASTPELAGAQLRLNHSETDLEIDTIEKLGTMDSFHEAKELQL